MKLTAQINGIDSWPGGYSVVLAGFTPDNAFAQTAKGISQTADGTINMVLAGIPSEVTQIEVCVINKLRKRIASFYTADYTEQADTIRLDAGKLDAGMFNSIQTEIFNRSCNLYIIIANCYMYHNTFPVLLNLFMIFYTPLYHFVQIC